MASNSKQIGALDNLSKTLSQFCISFSLYTQTNRNNETRERGNVAFFIKI